MQYNVLSIAIGLELLRAGEVGSEFSCHISLQWRAVLYQPMRNYFACSFDEGPGRSFTFSLVQWPTPG